MDKMNNKTLVVIDIQNDVTKHYRDIIDNINAAIEWAVAEDMHVVYIKHNNITAGTRTFKPGSKGEELVPEMKVVSDNIFVKTKSNALTSEAFSAFIAANGINEFYVAGADATGCVKSTCFNMTKALSATGDIRRLPLTRTAIITIIVLYSLRALAGIGSEMIREAIRMAESKGMQAVRLDALASNTPAHKIYKCLGFDYRGKQHLYAENTGWTDFYFFEYKYK